MCEEEKKTLAHLMIRAGHILNSKVGRGRGQGRILKILSEQAVMTQKELQEKLGIEAGSMSEIISKLERRDLVVRQRDEQDKRRMVLSLTDKGRMRHEERMEYQDHEEKLFTTLSGAEKEALERILSKLIGQWEDDHKRLGGGCKNDERI